GSKFRRLRLGQSAGPLLIHELEAVASRKAAHLLKPLNRHQGGERFALALDDKFVVSERDAIQHVANPRPDVHRRHFGGHSTTPASIIVAIVIVGKPRTRSKSTGNRMLLTIKTTHSPATDLGFLLHKHPDHVHTREFPFGNATVFYPEATAGVCTAAILLDVEPGGVVRRRTGKGGAEDQYVNDRPYVASSFLSVVLTRWFNSALG